MNTKTLNGGGYESPTLTLETFIDEEGFAASAEGTIGDYNPVITPSSYDYCEY